MMRQIYIVILCLLILLASACGEVKPESTGPSETTAVAIIDTVTQAQANAANWKEAYVQFALAALDSGERYDMLLLIDLNLDGTPELLLSDFREEYQYIIEGYTFSDGQGVALSLGEYIPAVLSLWQRKSDQSSLWLSELTNQCGGQYYLSWDTIDFTDLDAIISKHLFSYCKMPAGVYEEGLERHDDPEWLFFFDGLSGRQTTEQEIRNRMAAMTEGYSLVPTRQLFFDLSPMGISLDEAALREFFDRWDNEPDSVTITAQAPLDERYQHALYYEGPEGLFDIVDLPDTIGLSADLSQAEKAERVQAYLVERNMYKALPDTTAWRDDLPLAECYWDAQGDRLSIAAHTWHDSGEDNIYCGTLDLNAFKPIESERMWMLEDALQWLDYDARKTQISYSHHPMEYGTWGSSGWVYFDALGRPVEGSYYVTHGGHHRYYLYQGETVHPWAIVDFCSFPYSGSEDGSSVYGNSVSALLFPFAIQKDLPPIHGADAPLAEATYIPASLIDLLQAAWLEGTVDEVVTDLQCTEPLENAEAARLSGLLDPAWSLEETDSSSFYLVDIDGDSMTELIVLESDGGAASATMADLAVYKPQNSAYNETFRYYFLTLYSEKVYCTEYQGATYIINYAVDMSQPTGYREYVRDGVDILYFQDGVVVEQASVRTHGAAEIFTHGVNFDAYAPQWSMRI